MTRDPVDRLIDPAFLVANRTGRLASRQASRLGDGAYRSRFERVAGFVGVIGAAGAATVYGTSTAEAVPIVFLSAVVAILAGVVFRPWSDPLGRDVREGRVVSVTGRSVTRAPVDRVGRGLWAARYAVSVGPTRFPVPPWLWSAVDDARTVTAYYLPRSMTLLSIEAADEGEMPPLLPVAVRRRVHPAGSEAVGLYLGLVGLALVIRAFLPPVELWPAIPVGAAMVLAATVVIIRSRLAR